MNFDKNALNMIATSLSKHYDCIFYVDLESGEFEEFVHSEKFEKLNIPKQGEDFFSTSALNAARCVHPDDLELIRCLHNKEKARESLSKDPFHSLICRIIIDGKIYHVRHIFMMCEDNKHILFSMEDIEPEFQANKAQERKLRTAEQMARRDLLTGIKNKNAFTEYSEKFDKDIKTGNRDLQFAVVIFDLNNLKQLNDTRGHSFGDEAIQQTSRMICDVFMHSPVFRIGGDEFAVILTNSDFEQRAELFKEFKNESFENLSSRTGPVVACGLGVYNPETDKSFEEVFKRADSEMYENKNEVKSKGAVEKFRRTSDLKKVISAERKRKLDGLFGVMATIAGGAYLFLNDMRYDFSRWSLALVNDFDLECEYMYQADKVWEKYIHPDDLEIFKDAMNTVLSGNAEIKSLFYRARKPDGTYITISYRGFILCDSDGNPEYFGGIMVPQ